VESSLAGTNVVDMVKEVTRTRQVGTYICTAVLITNLSTKLDVINCLVLFVSSRLSKISLATPLSSKERSK
jgi:hypothetical protein